MTQSEPTHRVVRKAHRRSSNDGSPATVYEPGDELTPTERELERLPGRFEPLADDADETDDTSTDESAESDASTDAADDEGDTSGEDATDESADESAENEPESEGTPPGPTEGGELTAAWVEDADYNGLRSAAGEFDDVNGNWGEDRLRAELLGRAEGDA